MTLGKTFAEKQRERKGGAYDYVVAKLKRRIAEVEAENKRLRDLLHRWDALIEHQYTGSREAMSDMTYLAQETAEELGTYGKPPRAAIKGET